MKRTRRGQILAVCLGFWIGLGFIRAYLLGLQVGIRVGSLGLGGTLIFISALLFDE